MGTIMKSPEPRDGVVVEEGPTEEVIAHPRHPYTYLLLEAVPVPNPGLARQRAAARASEVLEGEPSGTGCVYSNRCPFAEAKCRDSRPEAVEVGVGHWVACYFPERVPAVGSVPPVGEGSGGPLDVRSHEGGAKLVGGSTGDVRAGGIASVDG